MWRQHCFDPIKDKLIPALLDLLDQDRWGNKQDKSLIRNMVQSYIEFGETPLFGIGYNSELILQHRQSWSK